MVVKAVNGSDGQLLHFYGEGGGDWLTVGKGREARLFVGVLARKEDSRTNSGTVCRARGVFDW